MLFTPAEFLQETARLSKLESGLIGFDFETTGLNPYKYDNATIMGFTNEKGEKFSVYLHSRVPPCSLKLWLTEFFSNPNLKYCAHNAKFELSFLQEQFGIPVQGIVWDTEVMARVESNKHMSYSLQSCAMRIKESKYAPMLDWLKKKGHKGKHAEAPPEILEPYVEHDAWLSWELARQQMNTFRHWDQSSPVPIYPIVKLELEMTTPLFDMERYGLLINVNYCRRALDYEQNRIRSAKETFKTLTGCEFVASRKCLEPIFNARGIPFGKTSLGNASFTEDSLKASKSDPIVRSILDIRASEKRASSYWENFLELEHNGIIHPSIHANRAATGRMSISDPSCQNWPTDDDDPEYPIRRAFIARPDCSIVSLDYSAMELRLICDEAEDMDMIQAIKNGVDFHQVVADDAGVPRNLAKNGRFAKLYGCGITKLAETLGVPEHVARTVSDAIDRTCPRVTEYTRELIKYAETNPYSYDFLGRRFYFDRGFAFKFPNYKTQAGCGEILRVAIREVSRFLRKERLSEETEILIPIHDELVINVHDSDMRLIPEIKRLMIAAHLSKKHLDMDVNIHVGRNFHDLVPYTH